ncbi:MAG: SDR family NAD(P)-dependent oxidoreductase, partial [bacterium]|nr:SDR family NAD(P)-dependent oxidoreductase [bacterium]
MEAVGRRKRKKVMATKEKKKFYIKGKLIWYDIAVYLLVVLLLLVFYSGNVKLTQIGLIQQVVISAVCIFAARAIGKIYGQVWRYGGIQCYIRLIATDAAAFVVYLGLELALPVQKISFARMLSLGSLNLLGALMIRMLYRYAYKCGGGDTVQGRFLSWVLYLVSGIESGRDKEAQKIKVAIIGAGHVGVGLAEELLNNEQASYTPRCFIDINKEKVGREIHGIPVWSEGDATLQKLDELEVQEIIFAIPSMETEKRKTLYNYYKNAGYKLKVYDYPTMQSAGKKRYLREFDIEELLFRKPLVVADKQTSTYYKDKIVLITGGGGSIGSELCRQLAKMNPKQIIILDIYENGAYDVQQELRIAYGRKLNLQIEICSITHKKALEKVFERYHPQIIINAAAHKHVPLMEHNCVEAIYNNVFGTKNLVELCEEYGAERFMMVSTDKA